MSSGARLASIFHHHDDMTITQPTTHNAPYSMSSPMYQRSRFKFGSHLIVLSAAVRSFRISMPLARAGHAVSPHWGK